MLTASQWCSFELVKEFSFESSCLILDLRQLLTNRLKWVEIQMSKMETFSSSRPASQCEEGWNLYAQGNPEISKDHVSFVRYCHLLHFINRLVEWVFFLIIRGRAQKVEQAPQNPSLHISFKAPDIIFNSVPKHTSLLIVGQLKQCFHSTQRRVYKSVICLYFPSCKFVAIQELFLPPELPKKCSKGTERLFTGVQDTKYILYINNLLCLD